MKWIDKPVRDFIHKPFESYCPSVLFKDAPARDVETTVHLIQPYRIKGCRGITCEACWNSEEGVE